MRPSDELLRDAFALQVERLWPHPKAIRFLQHLIDQNILRCEVLSLKVREAIHNPELPEILRLNYHLANFRDVCEGLDEPLWRRRRQGWILKDERPRGAGARRYDLVLLDRQDQIRVAVEVGELHLSKFLEVMGITIFSRGIRELWHVPGTDMRYLYWKRGKGKTIDPLLCPKELYWKGPVQYVGLPSVTENE